MKFNITMPIQAKKYIKNKQRIIEIIQNKNN